MSSATVRTLVWSVALLLVVVQVADACPTCKDSLAEGGNSENLVRGFGWSIIFMMSVPFLILAGLTSYFYYEVRRARLAQQSGTVIELAAGRRATAWNHEAT